MPERVRPTPPATIRTARSNTGGQTWFGQNGWLLGCSREAAYSDWAVPAG